MAKRKDTRKNAMELMFQMEIQNDFSDEAIEKFQELNSLTVKQRDYMSLLFRNIEERLEKVDTVIEENAENWRIQRLAKVDLSILRIALIEMFYVEEVPIAVAINEAVSLAKIYGSDNSAKFINGILGTIVRAKK
mgnify:FL=1